MFLKCRWCMVWVIEFGLVVLVWCRFSRMDCVVLQVKIVQRLMLELKVLLQCWWNCCQLGILFCGGLGLRISVLLVLGLVCMRKGKFKVLVEVIRCVFSFNWWMDLVSMLVCQFSLLKKIRFGLRLCVCISGVLKLEVLLLMLQCVSILLFCVFILWVNCLVSFCLKGVWLLMVIMECMFSLLMV